MLVLLELWGIELVKGIGKLFINPLFYWGIIVVVLISIFRIKNERKQFGVKLHGLFSEVKNTLLISITFSILLSVLSIVFGGILTYETVIILIIITGILSLFGSARAMSSAYIIGLTYIVFLLLPVTNLINMDYYLENQTILIAIFTTLAFLTGLLLFAEGWMIRSPKNQPTYPKAVLGKRGIWIGEHHLNKLMFIPFFAFIPLQTGEGIAPFLPYFDYNGEAYSLILIPIIFGFNYRVRGQLPASVTNQLGKSTILLSIVVLIVTASSLFYSDLSLLAILIALIGKLIINLRFKFMDNKKIPFFRPLKQGVRILALIPDGPAERLGIEIGECVLKVNGTFITDADEFYVALQNSGAFFKLEVLDHAGEKRFITSAFYEEDHYELGILFQGKTYRS